MAAFQSTPPRGGRQEHFILLMVNRRFNPRPRAGGDFSMCFMLAMVAVSIHAPARGATKAKSIGFRDNGFQSTPPRGGRLGVA